MDDIVALVDRFSALALPRRPEVTTEEELGRYARAVDNFIGALATELSRDEMRLGIALFAVREERLYEVLGHATFDAYRASRGLSKSSVYRYLEQAETYLLPKQPPASPVEVAQMGLMKSLVIAPLVRGKTREEAAELVADAINLTESDLRTLLEEREGAGPDPMTACIRGIRSQIHTFLARLAVDQPEIVLYELSGEALRWHDQVKRMRAETR